MGRTIFLCLSVLGSVVVGGASPPRNSAQPEQAQTEQAIAKSLGEISAALKLASDAQKPNDPCAEGEEKRESDLCAQWKAADAAHEASVWTRRGFWVGLVTFGAAFFAAIFAGLAAHWARDNARTAKAHLKQAEDFSKRELRAYVSILETQDRIDLRPGTTDAFDFSMWVALKNTGATPAMNCRVVTRWVSVDPGDPRPLFDVEHCEVRRMSPIGPNIVIHSDKQRMAYDNVYEASFKRKALYLYVRCDYEDIWENHWWTEVCLRTHPEFKPQNITAENHLSFKTLWSSPAFGDQNGGT